jgi:hypothetical protein
LFFLHHGKPEIAWQSFATTISSANWHFPEIEIRWMPRDPGIVLDDLTLDEISAVLRDLGSAESGNAESHAAGMPVRGNLMVPVVMQPMILVGEDVSNQAAFLFAQHLNERGRPNDAMQQYIREVFEKALVPVQNSPLRGVTLASLLSGTTAAINLFYDQPGKLAATVFIAAGSVIILGIADSIRAVLCAAIEVRLASVLGLPDQKEAAHARRFIRALEKSDLGDET